MTHDEISLNTRLALANSLKKFLEKKPLNKITVTELIKDCNLNRNTFYYHFSDIYELFQWTLEYEAFENIDKLNLTEDFNSSIIFAINYIKNNKHMLNNVYDTLGQDELKRFLQHDFETAAAKLIDHTAGNMEAAITDTYRTFLIQFFSSAIANALIAYFSGENGLSDEDTAQYLSFTINNSLNSLLSSFASSDIR